MKPILLKVAGRLCLILLLLLTMRSSQAQTGAGVVLKKVLEGGKGQLVKDSVVTVQDSIYFDASVRNKLDTPYYLRNTVTFRINEYANIYLTAPFSATINIRIYYTRPDLVVDSSDQSLTINYDTAHAYTLRNSFVFNNAHEVQVKVLELTSNASQDITAALVLENEMELHPVYKLNCVDDAIKSISSDNPANTDSTDEITVNWPVVTGADVYDLEWAYIDSSALESGRFETPVNPKLIFANNTTRVTVSGNTYAIPLLYDKVGVLYFRVRAVQEKSNDNRLETNWSSDYSGGMGKYIFDGHQRRLNWQSSVSYAEDGKRKVVVQYFDGSLRSRQTVTKDNTTNKTIAGEAFYDYQGRPVVQVLPVPTLSNVLKYTRNLNPAVNGTEYDKDNYDFIETPAEYPAAAAKPMGNSSGANQYYSPANPDKNNGVNQYIPDAGGYAFTETAFTQDNTGRIARQGGVGSTFRLGSKHEAKYYYGTASQEELDALFGTEVGDNTHYFKNAVSDANGQMSVSYVDMHGRTVATALAGTTENNNLRDLPSKETLIVTDSLSGAGKNTVSDLVLESHHSQIVNEDGVYKFKYLLVPPVMQKKDCNGNTISYPGLYDLHIRITDDAYNQHLGGKPFDTILHNYNADNFPASGDEIAVEFELPLVKGTYEISKSLTVNRQAMDYYRDSIFLKTNVCTTVEKMIEEQLILQRNKGCYPDCGTCDSTQTEEDDLLRMMLQDVSPPAGQYALTQTDSYYSVLLQPNENTAAPYTRVSYLNEVGEADSVYNQTSGKYVVPQSLLPEDFIKYFKPSWANSLLPLHPEYCKYLKFRELNAAQQWDKDFGSTETYFAAKQKGYLNPVSDQPRFPGGNEDPLAQIRRNELSSMLNQFQAGYSLWVVATLSVRCPDMKDTCVAAYGNISAAFDESTMCGGDLDMAWRSFRNLYQNGRRKIIDNWINSNASCPYTNVQLLQANKIPRFNNVNDALGQVGIPPGFEDGKAAAGSGMDAMYAANCNAYVKTWVSQLAPCKYDTAALREITDKLLIVCKGGADEDHPYGASTVKAGSNAQYSSFDAVLREYNSRHAITDPLICNYELITAPQPYDRQRAATNIPTYTRPNDCECGNLQGLGLEYNTLKKPGDTTLSAYLQRTRGIKILQSDLDALIAACNMTSGACNYLSKPIDVPVFLQCYVAPPCVPCRVTDSLLSAFETDYDGIVPSMATLDSVQERKNRLFANYMNNHLGYSKEAHEYLSFIDSCRNQPVGEGTLVCNPGSVSTQRLVNSYSNGGTDVISDIRNTNDNGYIMAGSTTGNTNGGKDGYIIKTDSSGALQWAKTYGGLDNDVFVKLTPTSDGGYVAVGTTSSYCYANGAILVVKLDTGGNVIWNKAIDFGNDHGGKGTDIIQLTDGRYAFGGLRSTGGVNTDWITGVLTDAGEVGWIRQTGSTSNREQISLAEDNDTLIAGTAISGETGYDVIVLKIDKENGSLLTMDQYDLEQRSNITNAILKTASGYRLAVVSLTGPGVLATNGMLLDLDPGGAVQLARKIGSAGAIDPASWTASFTADGGVITSQSTQDAYWHKYDAAGSLQWSSHVRIPGSERLFRLTQHIDGTYAGAGLYGNSAMLMLANRDGKTGCKDTTEIFSEDIIRSDRYMPVQQTTVSITTNNVSSVVMVEKPAYPTVTTISCPGIDSCFRVFEGPMLCGNITPVFPEITLSEINSCSDSTIFANSKGMELYNTYRDSVINDFDKDYVHTALSADYLEQFALTYNSTEYHYTLYYYDQAGNLVKTVPPAGVVKSRSKGWTDSVRVARRAGQVLVPAHRLTTNYRYNTLNQVVLQHTPDGGTSRFWYDRLGRLSISQNARQLISNAYSYTLYDELGRITEVGETTSSAPMVDAISRSATALSQWMVNAGGNRSQITRTVYDIPYAGEGPVWTATNLRNRVSWSAVYNSVSDTLPGNQAAATYYSYDIHGNVRTLLQEYNSGVGNDGNRFKKIDYTYDLISGKVNTVSYQRGLPDAFYHRYSYDAENRLTNAETSRDSIYWENDAFYQYYKHGPLARAIIGQQQVQGLDYAYTLQGWLKGVNSTTLTPGFDIGGDGATGGITARDAFGFSLHYFGDDEYKPINSTVRPFASAGAGLASLYNGNISGMSVNLPKAGVPLFYNYTYDVLNRLVNMNTGHNLNATTNTWAPISVGDFGERISYDPNGNILRYDRKGNNTWAGKPLDMDSMTYHYTPGTNRLRHIKDLVATEQYDLDIDNQDDDNYLYDSIGNLIRDKQAGISVQWNIYGKISQITKDDSTRILYTYDVAGNRISKKVGDRLTRYIRDATGNVMSVYEAGNAAISNGHLSQIETHLYGSSRLGISNYTTLVDNPEAPVPVRLGTFGSGTFTTFTRGNKIFELSNHLGNVLATVSDDKKAFSVDGLVVDHYEANVVSAQDYAPFGMGLVGRGFASGGYRYGFNGKENDNEIKGDGNQQDYGMRVYDPRIGKFLSVDPLTKSYPELTPYQFASNTPIQGADFDGLELINNNKDPHFLKIVGGQAVFGTVTATVVRETVKYSTKMVVNSAGQLVLRQGLRLGGSALGGAALTVGLTLLPMHMGNPEGSLWWQNYIHHQPDGSFTKFTDDQSNVYRVLDPEEVIKKLPQRSPLIGVFANPDKGEDVILYRGVHAKHPDLPNARLGMAIPWGLNGGHSSPTKHNENENYSIFTSWSLSEKIAKGWATERGLGGVLLTKKFKISQLVPSPDRFEEQEVLVPGVVTGADVKYPK